MTLLVIHGQRLEFFSKSQAVIYKLVKVAREGECVLCTMKSQHLPEHNSDEDADGKCDGREVVISNLRLKRKF